MCLELRGTATLADIPSGYKFLRGMSTLRILRIHDPALGPGNSLRATGQVLHSPRGDERTYLAVGPLHPPTHRAAPQLQPQAYHDSQRSTRQGVGPVQMLLRQRRHCERGREVARSLAARPARALRLRRRPTSLSASLGEPTPRFERRWKGLAECASVMICCAVLCEVRWVKHVPELYGSSSSPSSTGREPARGSML